LDPRVHYIDIDGNTTLTNLTDGTHKIIVFADCYDEYHDGISVAQGTSFNVSIDVNATEVEYTKESQNNLASDNGLMFLTTAAVTIVVAVAAVVYVKKRKRV
jgi:hypothetical protein